MLFFGFNNLIIGFNNLATSEIIVTTNKNIFILYYYFLNLKFIWNLSLLKVELNLHVDALSLLIPDCMARILTRSNVTLRFCAR